jgi:hypothetical protein
MNLRSCTFAALAIGVALLPWNVRRPEGTNSAEASARPSADGPRPADVQPTPVLVELFTSEGCSSCPPADALLSRLGKTQPVSGAQIIALEEHVDYWDHLGWKDPFSSEEATSRQSEFGEAFGGKQIYTPQMVVDGHIGFVGSSDSEALRAIRQASQAPKTAIRLSWEQGDMLGIRVEPLSDASVHSDAQLFLVVAENMLHSDVKHGENAGRALEHNGVVRQIRLLGKMNSAPPGFSSTVAAHAAREWNRANLRAVVFVQDRRSRQVLAAAVIPFPAA